MQFSTTFLLIWTVIVGLCHRVHSDPFNATVPDSGPHRIYTNRDRFRYVVVIADISINDTESASVDASSMKAPDSGSVTEAYGSASVTDSKAEERTSSQATKDEELINGDKTDPASKFKDDKSNATVAREDYNDTYPVTEHTRLDIKPPTRRPCPPGYTLVGHECRPNL